MYMVLANLTHLHIHTHAHNYTFTRTYTRKHAHTNTRAPCAVMMSTTRSATERCVAIQALLWAQLKPEAHTLVTPATLLKAASHGEPCTQTS